MKKRNVNIERPYSSSLCAQKAQADQVVFTIAALIGGTLIFNRMESSFVDTV